MHDICDSTIVLQVLVLEATGVLLEIQLVIKLYKLQQDKTKTLKKLENTSLKPQGLLLIGPKTAKTPRRCVIRNAPSSPPWSIFVFDWALIGDDSSSNAVIGPSISCVFLAFPCVVLLSLDRAT